MAVSIFFMTLTTVYAQNESDTEESTSDNQTGMEMSDERREDSAHDSSEMGNNAHGGRHARPDAVAPAGVMGDHTHHEGRWMVSLKFMSMEMDGNRLGDDRKSLEEMFYFPQYSPQFTTVKSNGQFVQVLNPGAYYYSAVPIRMRMNMYMAGAMYGVSDNLTIMNTLPLIKISMDHMTRRGQLFKTETDGVGDYRFGMLYRFVNTDMHRLHWNLGLSLPTGSIEKKDDTPVGYKQKLPYPMQTGSGTYDILPGVTYRGFAEDFSWGAQLLATLRTSQNKNDYRLGNVYESSLWIAYRLLDWLSVSVRLNGIERDNIEGADPDYDPQFIATADPERRGGRVVRALLGFNFLIPGETFGALRLNLEYGEPIYQHLNGPHWKRN